TDRGRKLRREIETFEVQIEDLEDELTEQRDIERAHRQAETPPVAVVYEQAVRLDRMLWTRRPEHWNFLALRLGVARAASRNSVTGGDGDKGIPKYQKRVDALRRRFAEIDDVPLVETLASAGAIGIAGSQADVADIVRG